MATIKTNATNSINDMNIKFEMLIKQLTDDAVSAGNNFIAEEHLLPTLAIYSKFHTKNFLPLSTMLSKQVGKKIGLTVTVIIVAVTRTKVMPSLRSIAPSHSPLRLWFSRGRTKFLKWKPSDITVGNSLLGISDGTLSLTARGVGSDGSLDSSTAVLRALR